MFDRQFPKLGSGRMTQEKAAAPSARNLLFGAAEIAGWEETTNARFSIYYWLGSERGFLAKPAIWLRELASIPDRPSQWPLAGLVRYAFRLAQGRLVASETRWK